MTDKVEDFMSKRRIVIVTSIVLVLAMSMAIMVACGGDKPLPNIKPADVEFYPDNFVKVDYSNMEEVAGVDAFELLTEVYNTWVNDKGYKRTQYFSFKAHPAGVPITNFCHEIYKIDGDKLLRYQTVIQNGQPMLAPDKREFSRFYFDGTKAYRGVLDDEKERTKIPGDPEHEKGIFYVAEMPAMSDFVGKDEKDTVESRLKTYTSHMTTYAWNDKKNLVDDGFKVYKAADGTLRFTITIDCSDKNMHGVHVKAREEFEESTGAKAGTVKMRQNTTLDLVVKEINGVKKIIAWRRTEQYEGRLGVKIPAEQTCIETFSYDEKDYKITPEDIA